MKEYISKTDMEHCRQIKEIFRKLSEDSRDFCVVDAYPFGCVVLEWFAPERGFDRQEYFTDTSELFDYLLETWENIYLFEMEKIYGSTEMSEEDIKEILPQERKKEMEKIREGYIMQYEECRASW